ncbi:hypothetical protein STRIP9103_08138 [Streptomyces ipomoeae 91-03]|jgi:AcrR family transcriptional regulator|uniref:Uncharacterized protein n=1 Tax=Streptomyces ipomoeae 91-03 TaxID=698759 RepID=L1KYS1_9ACTN|nr:hypothetical protein STRIP9103_08138 [Streptomyces ipomoeae 91-03]
MSADAEGLTTHLTEPGLLVLRERLAERLLAVPATPRLLALQALLLALLEQRHDRVGQRLLHGLLHGVADGSGERAVQREGHVRVRLLGEFRPVLQLLLDLLDLLERLLHLLGDLLGRLLTRLLDGLLDHLGDLLLAAQLLATELLAVLLEGLSTGHHRHECSVQCHGEVSTRSCADLSDKSDT